MLRINLDETSVCLFQGTGKGTVFFSRKRGPPGTEPVQLASTKKRRACLTHVAVVCDNPTLQPLLPQYVIGNLQTFLLREWRALLASCPDNVVLVRQKSAWVNIEVFVEIVNRLGVVLRPYLGSVQPVLLMDTCPVHLASRVVKACFASQLWPVFVPARLTWLLQPCDTHVFLQYKAKLKAFTKQVGRGPPGETFPFSSSWGAFTKLFGNICKAIVGHLLLIRMGSGRPSRQCQSPSSDICNKKVL